MGDFLTKNPFLRLVVALSAGIVAFVCIGFRWWVLLSVVVISVALFVIYITTKNRHRIGTIFGLSAILSIVALGYWLGYDFDSRIPRFAENKKQGFFEVELTRYPIEKQNSVLLYTDLLQYSDSTSCENIKGKAILYLQKDSNSLSLKSGDKLIIYTTLSLPEKTGNPDEFDFGRHLLRNGICGTGYASNERWKRISGADGFSLMRLAQRCRLKLLDISRKMNIDGNEFAIISALTLGYTDAISPELRDSFSVTGASHILSVSGLHVGIIYVMLGFLLGFLDKWKRTRKIKWIAVILFLWFYAFVTGLSPSVSRSVFMFSLFALAKITDRQSSVYNNIFLSAFVLLIINPMWLFNVGFQLSYSALLSILYFQPKIAKWLVFKNRILTYCWELTSVSIAAQLGAAPLCLYYFHQFPNYFLLSNFVGVPLSGIIIYLDVALLITNSIPMIGSIVSWLLVTTTKLMYGGLKIIENLPFVTTNIWIDSVQLILIYASVFAVGLLMYKIKYKYFLLFFVSAILFLGINIFRTVSDTNIDELVVFNSKQSVTVNMVNSRQNTVITNNVETSKTLAKDFWLHHDIAAPDYHILDTIFGIDAFRFADKNFVVISSNKIYDKYATTLLTTDYLIITKGVSPSENLLKYYFAPKCIVLTADVGTKSKRVFERLSKTKSIGYYSIAEQGAFRIRGKRIQPSASNY
jgi:ComEC/Rec2-like protein